MRRRDSAGFAAFEHGHGGQIDAEVSSGSHDVQPSRAEEEIRGLLRERVGLTFGFSKVEVVDAAGRNAGEIDGAIYEELVRSSPVDQRGRRLVRVESLAAVVEVRAHVSPGELERIGSSSCESSYVTYVRPA